MAQVATPVITRTFNTVGAVLASTVSYSATCATAEAVLNWRKDGGSWGLVAPTNEGVIECYATKEGSDDSEIASVTTTRCPSCMPFPRNWEGAIPEGGTDIVESMGAFKIAVVFPTNEDWGGGYTVKYSLDGGSTYSNYANSEDYKTINVLAVAPTVNTYTYKANCRSSAVSPTVTFNARLPLPTVTPGNRKFQVNTTVFAASELPVAQGTYATYYSTDGQQPAVRVDGNSDPELLTFPATGLVLTASTRLLIQAVFTPADHSTAVTSDIMEIFYVKDTHNANMPLPEIRTIAVADF